MKSYVSKRISVQMNKGRHVTGVLLGFDQFMNIVLDGKSSLYEQSFSLLLITSIHNSSSRILNLTSLEYI